MLTKDTYKLVDTLFSEKKSSAKNVEKSTDYLSDTLFSEEKSSTLDVDKRYL